MRFFIHKNPLFYILEYIIERIVKFVNQIRIMRTLFFKCTSLKILIGLSTIFFLRSSFLSQNISDTSNYVRKAPVRQVLESSPNYMKVNPMIGTGGHGHTYPGATSPFGMVQLSPDTRLDGWDGCSGYHNSDSIIYGFSHTHLQGTGVSDYGDILLMPCTKFTAGATSWQDRYKSRFQKDTEYAHAGYYSVFLEDQNIQVELTTTPRTGIHKYTLTEPDTLTLIIDLEHRDKLINYSIYPLDDSTIVGHRLSENWAKNQYVYFAIRFNKEFKWSDQLSEIKTVVTNKINGSISQEMEFVPVFAVDFGVITDLTVRVGLSFCDTEGAVKNLTEEAPHSDFSDYRKANEEVWEEQLKRIEVSGGDGGIDQQEIFYTALYHTFTVPNLASDVDGRYRGTDLKIHNLRPVDGFHYTVFSLWDTFRSLHPLLAWIEPGRTRDFIRSMLRMYKDGGQLPVWELASNYTGCMIGYHSIPVIADAKAWGIIGIDQNLALEAMVQAADSMHLGLESYVKYGYIPSEKESEGVSKTLEYSYDDACIAAYAESLGEIELSERFRQRSLFWRNLLNPESHFIQPKRDGAWIAGFDPTEVNFNYTEANGWQYTFFAPHDISGLIKFEGGTKERFSEMVERQFLDSSMTSGRTQVDISGLMGQYAHGNEPSHHVAYLFSYAGQQYRTVEIVNDILNKLYTSEPDGLCGNEDCGQMSAWYVLSSIGLYPVAPGSQVSAQKAQLVVGSPQFDNVIVTPAISNRSGGVRPLYISKIGEGDYVKTVNSKTRSWMSYEEILKGGPLVFEMTDSINTGFGILDGDSPSTSVSDSNFVPVPAFVAGRSFQGKYSKVRLHHLIPDACIYYKIDDGVWHKYKSAIKIKSDAELFAYAEINKVRSKEVHHSLVKIKHDWDVNYTFPYSHQYAASGLNTLVDGLKGGNEYRTGDWQGFYDSPFEATIDLGAMKSISGMSLGCIQDIRPWIWLPESVEFFTSNDGVNFTLFDKVTHDIDENNYSKIVHRFITENSIPITHARYVRVKANSTGPIPNWHLGAGNNRWTFVDEWEITFESK
ncbi:MAG: hypothetical protein COA49_04970 [Bacteroidetes bacterium]|nr:MAG: hypothetical protein COA49_04970 [Bacteroidota bacterium]